MDMDTENRIVTPDLWHEDNELEFFVGALQVAYYFGQDKANENVSVYI